MTEKYKSGEGQLEADAALAKARVLRLGYLGSQGTSPQSTRYSLKTNTSLNVSIRVTTVREYSEGGTPGSATMRTCWEGYRLDIEYFIICSGCEHILTSDKHGRMTTIISHYSESTARHEQDDADQFVRTDFSDQEEVRIVVRKASSLDHVSEKCNSIFPAPGWRSIVPRKENASTGLRRGRYIFNTQYIRR